MTGLGKKDKRISCIWMGSCLETKWKIWLVIMKTVLNFYILILNLQLSIVILKLDDHSFGNSTCILSLQDEPSVMMVILAFSELLSFKWGKRNRIAERGNRITEKERLGVGLFEFIKIFFCNLSLHHFCYQLCICN